jgi:hypothetical protein
LVDSIAGGVFLMGMGGVLFVSGEGWYCSQNLDMFFLSDENEKAYTKMKHRYGTDRLSYFSDMLKVSGILK